jgi:hypothetical protein
MKVYLRCRVVVTAADLRRVGGLPVLTPRQVAPRQRPGDRRTERRRRVRGTGAARDTSAMAQSTAYLQGVRGSGVVAHRRGWDGSPAMASREG